MYNNQIEQLITEYNLKNNTLSQKNITKADLEIISHMINDYDNKNYEKLAKNLLIDRLNYYLDNHKFALQDMNYIKSIISDISNGTSSTNNNDIPTFKDLENKEHKE